jgi:hypothetical protein
VESKLAIEAAAELARKSDGTVRLWRGFHRLPSLARMMGVAVNDRTSLISSGASEDGARGRASVGDTKVESELSSASLPSFSSKKEVTRSARAAPGATAPCAALLLAASRPG